jgi:flagellar basal-body rod modification protein FlgD
MAAVESVKNASDLQMNYMTLLVTQLQNQNPLEPMDNKDMSAQLAQFSQLEQLESMNSSFGHVLDSVQRSYASSLIGKEVSFVATASDGSQETLSGTVEEVVMDKSGDISLVIDGATVDLADVSAVRQ